MKQLLYKRRTRPQKGIKSLVIHSKTQDKESKTEVRKSFAYNVTRCDAIEEEIAAPDICITKSINTKKRIEKFTFSVRGCFYLTHQRCLYKVDFHHMLKIKIIWKTKDFSPKKSEVLTE